MDPNSQISGDVTACPHADRLRDFSHGMLSEADLETVAQHVETCSACEEKLAELDDSGDTVIRQLYGSDTFQALLDEPEFQQLKARAKAIPGDQPEPGFGRAATVPFADEELPKQVGQYRLQKKLGRGGMGVVYQAEHVNLKHAVAVKLLPADRMQDERVLSRFYREMAAVGKLQHENVVRATDGGETDGYHILVMEYVAGSDLGHALRTRGPLPAADACEIARQTALGLDAIHQAGQVHRDIKPSNLMLTAAGTVKILDLGLARLQSEAATDDGLTRSDQILGSLDYMSPEQARNSKSADIRSDIYSLGCTLYHLLIGRAPFSGVDYESPAAKLVAHSNDPVNLTAVPDKVAPLLERMLAKDPDDRYATPAEVATALEPWAGDAASLADTQAQRGTPTDALAPTESLVVRPKKKKADGSRSRTKTAVVVVTLVAIVVGIGLATLPFLLDRDPASSSLADLPPGSGTRHLDVLVWPRLAERSDLSVLDNRNALKVVCDDMALIGVSALTKSNYEFGVRVQQLQWTKGVGIFFAYNEFEIDNERQVGFRAFEIDADADQRTMSIVPFECVLTPDGSTSVRRSPPIPLDQPFEIKLNLELRLEQGRIVEFSINDIPYEAALQIDGFSLADKEDMSGVFGLLVWQSEALFSKITVDGVELPLAEK